MSEPVDAPIFQLVRLLLRRWRVVVVFAVLAAGISTAYALLTPVWFSANLKVVPSMKSSDAGATSLVSRLPLGLDSVSTDVQRIQAVFTSNSVSDAVIEKFELRKRYGAEHIEDARSALWEHCSTSLDQKSDVVSLTCEDQDPQEAKEITTYFAEVANDVFRRVSSSSSGEERKFLDAQVAKAQQEVDNASNKLREFQEKNKIIDLPEQSKAVISAMASIQADLLTKQLDLSYLRSFSARGESNVVQLEQQISVMESKLKELEATQTHAPAAGRASSRNDSKAAFFPEAMSVPGLRFEFESLVREQKMKETILFLMTQRLELAKIDEARDTSTFQVLDYPTLPSIKTRPKRKLIVATGVFIGIALACVWVVLPYWWRRRIRTALAIEPA